MEQEFRKILAFNIKIERIRNHITQEKLAELVGVSTKHITKIEAGVVTPSVYLVYKIAKNLKVSMDLLTSTR